MNTSTVMNVAANVVAVLHLVFVVFIVGEMIVILTPSARETRFVRDRSLRLLHVIAIYIVLVEEATGWSCPLNVLQWNLRSEAIGSAKATVGLGGLLDFLLYRTVPPIALDIMYWSFGLLVIVWLFVAPPRWHRL